MLGNIEKENDYRELKLFHERRLRYIEDFVTLFFDEGEDGLDDLILKLYYVSFFVKKGLNMRVLLSTGDIAIAERNILKIPDGIDRVISGNFLCDFNNGNCLIGFAKPYYTNDVEMAAFMAFVSVKEKLAHYNDLEKIIRKLGCLNKKNLVEATDVTRTALKMFPD